MVPKWSTDGYQVVTKSNNHPEMVTKWSQSGLLVVTKWSPSGHQVVTKWSQKVKLFGVISENYRYRKILLIFVLFKMAK